MCCGCVYKPRSKTIACRKYIYLFRPRIELATRSITVYCSAKKKYLQQKQCEATFIKKYSYIIHYCLFDYRKSIPFLNRLYRIHHWSPTLFPSVFDTMQITLRCRTVIGGINIHCGLCSTVNLTVNGPSQKSTKAGQLFLQLTSDVCTTVFMHDIVMVSFV